MEENISKAEQFPLDTEVAPVVIQFQQLSQSWFWLFINSLSAMLHAHAEYLTIKKLRGHANIGQQAVLALGRAVELVTVLLSSGPVAH